MAQLGAGPLQQTFPIRQFDTLIEAEIHPLSVRQNVDIAVDHLPWSNAIRRGAITEPYHLTGIGIDLENEPPQRFRNGTQ